MIPVRSKVFAVAALAAPASAAGLSGCTVIASDAPLDDAGPATYSSCNECLYQSCIGQWSVCGGSSECMAIYTCSTAPGCDQACVDNCYLSHPRGQASYYALASCDDVSKSSATCTPLCSATTPDAGTPDSSPEATTPDADVDAIADAAAPDAPDDAAQPDAAPDSSAPDAGTVQTCTDCTSQKCASEKASCVPSTPCDTYTNCLAACADLACVNKCGTDHPDGKTASAKLGDCVSMSCSRECGL
jgi:hypothetical protein